MGRPKGKKDSKPRTKKSVGKPAVKNKFPTRDDNIKTFKTKTEDVSAADEFVPDAEPETAAVPEQDLTAEVELLLKASFEGLALIFQDSEIGLTTEEASGSAPSCVAFYTRVIKPKIENTDTLAAAVTVSALLMSRAPRIKASIDRWRAQKVLKTTRPVYPQTATTDEIVP